MLTSTTLHNCLNTNQYDLRVQTIIVELNINGESTVKNWSLNIQNLTQNTHIFRDISISSKHNNFNSDVVPPQILLKQPTDTLELRDLKYKFPYNQVFMMNLIQSIIKTYQEKVLDLHITSKRINCVFSIYNNETYIIEIWNITEISK